MIEIRRKEGESVNAFLYRFTRKIQHAGLIKEAKKRRFHSRSVNKHARRTSALYRLAKRRNIERLRKLGKIKAR
jgi:ribosomal protein S21